MNWRFVSLLFLGTSLIASPWGDWRGPTADGHAGADANPPLEWGGEEKKNVLWEVDFGGRLGHSSPVILDGRCWVTAATEDGTEQSVICIDLESGEVVLDRVLFTNEAPEPLGNSVNNYAAPSCAIDAEAGRVVVHFGSYGTACLDGASGEMVWERRDLECRHYRGPGSSPVIYRDLVILTFDGVDLQYVTGLDRATGETVWRTDRSTPWDDVGEDGEVQREGDMRKSFSTPVIVEVKGRDQLVAISSKMFFGYDPATGEALWSHWHGLGHTGSSRPVVAGDLALLNTGYGKAQMIALQMGEGELGEEAREWIKTKNVPNRASPIIVGDHVYMVDDGGVACCVEVATGEEMWRERLGGKFSGSPIYAGGRLYFSNEEGGSWVVAAKPEFEVLAENVLEEGTGASPVAVGEMLILRTKVGVVALGE